jgi:hypothetical protein
MDFGLENRATRYRLYHFLALIRDLKIVPAFQMWDIYWAKNK